MSADVFVRLWGRQNARKRWTVVAILLVIVVSWSGWLDRKSTDYVDAAIVKSTVAFGTARAINSAVSIAQSTTISVELVGGMSVGVGEGLDPINDLVEQYSDLMQLSIGSLVIQKVLLEIISHTVFKVSVAVLGIALLLVMSAGNPLLVAFFTRAFVFFVFLRFILVFTVFLNGIVSEAFIAEKTNADIAMLEQLPGDVQQIQDAPILSVEQQDSLNGQLAQLKTESQATQQALADLEGRITEATEEVAALEMAYDEILASTSWRSIFTGDNPDLIAAQQEFYAADGSLETLVDEKETLEEALADIEDETTFAENEIAGKPNSLMEAAKQNMAAVRRSMSIAAIQQKFEVAVSGMIEVMTLFILETIILPLFFLYLLTRGLKSIWGIDLSKYIRPKQEILVAP